MPILTAIILAAFVGYGSAWYFGAIEGNFALLLFMATVVAGLYWLAERLFFLPRRRAAASALQAQEAQRRADLAAQGNGKRRNAEQETFGRRCNGPRINRVVAHIGAQVDP